MRKGGYIPNYSSKIAIEAGYLKISCGAGGAHIGTLAAESIELKLID